MKYTTHEVELNPGAVIDCQASIDAAVKAEREAIIYEVVELLEHICEENDRRYGAALCRKIAAAIRERGK